MAIFYQSFQKFPTSEAACILVHGLNNKPEVLKELAGFLESLSMPVISVSLTGHYKDFDKLKSITQASWHGDVLEAYTLARKQYAQIYLVAYSLGATVSLDILSEKIKFDKMVLLAPAIAPRFPVQLLGFIAPLWPSLPLFSITPTAYRANPYLPLRTYAILHQLYRSLKNKKFAYANVPAVIVMDPKDETMSLKKVKRTINTYDLSHWKTLSLNSNEAIKEVKYHHLIIDKKGMGSKNWKVFTRSIQNFLGYKHQ